MGWEHCRKVTGWSNDQDGSSHLLEKNKTRNGCLRAFGLKITHKTICTCSGHMFFMFMRWIIRPDRTFIGKHAFLHAHTLSEHGSLRGVVLFPRANTEHVRLTLVLLTSSYSLYIKATAARCIGKRRVSCTSRALNWLIFFLTARTLPPMLSSAVTPTTEQCGILRNGSSFPMCFSSSCCFLFCGLGWHHPHFGEQFCAKPKSYTMGKV